MPHDFLNQLPEIINKVFDVLDLLVVRVSLLALAALGAYHLIKGTHEATNFNRGAGDQRMTVCIVAEYPTS